MRDPNSLRAQEARPESSLNGASIPAMTAAPLRSKVRGACVAVARWVGAPPPCALTAVLPVLMPCVPV